MRMSDWEPSEAWQPIRRALDARRSAIEDAGVNLRGGYVPVPEELLHGADVVAVFQQVGGEGVAEGVGAGRFDRTMSSIHGKSCSRTSR